MHAERERSSPKPSFFDRTGEPVAFRFLGFVSHSLAKG
jgi:hypothetical protein